MTDFKADLPQPSKRGVVLGFISGLIVGMVITGAAVIYFTHHAAHAQTITTPMPAATAVAVDTTSVSTPPTDRPSIEEARDYLEGKTFTLAEDPAAKAGPVTITIKKNNISDLQWHSSGNTGGDQFPWSNSYSFLYDHEGKAYVVDALIQVRKVGSSLAFLEFNAQKVTPTDRVRKSTAAVKK